MAITWVLVCFIVMAMVVELAVAASHTVGGPNGWDMSTDLPTWASTRSFVVGDNIVFQYAPSHDVVEVTKAEYDACTASNPLATFTDGNTVVPLTSAGKRYFLCGFTGHCNAGMKLEINTLSTSLTNSPVSSPEPKSLGFFPVQSPGPSIELPSSFSGAPTLGFPTSFAPTSSSTTNANVLSPSSSAYKDGFQANLVVGFGIAIFMLYSL